jgi:hypothetical protein
MLLVIYNIDSRLVSFKLEGKIAVNRIFIDEMLDKMFTLGTIRRVEPQVGRGQGELVCYI